MEEYKNKIFKSFCEKLEKEKNAEKEREEILNGITDESLKEKMEKKFGVDRALIDMKLKEEYKKLNEKVKKYERNLRNEYYQKKQLLVSLDIFN